MRVLSALAVGLSVFLLGTRGQAEPPVTLPPEAYSSVPPAVPPGAPRPRPEQVYNVSAEFDFPMIFGGTVLWVGPSLALGNIGQPPPCDPCDASKLNALDRKTIRYHHEWARLPANLIYILPGVWGALDILDVGASKWRGWGSDLSVIAEALVIGGVIQQVTRHAVERPRPFMYTPGVYPADRGLPEANRSYFSGHTSSMFSLAASFAYTYQLRHPDSGWRFVVWPALLSAAGVQSGLRVASGDHFPSDVIIGALVGVSAGIMIPALHRRQETTAAPVFRDAQLVPYADKERATLSLGASF